MSAASTVLGADPDELDRAAAELRSAADDLDRHAIRLNAGLRSTMWAGGAATWFVGQWDSHHHQRLGATAAHLRDAATRLGADAIEQRHASAPSSAGNGSGSRGTAPTGWVDPARVHEVLGRFGLARAELDAAAAAARRIHHSTTANRLLDLLADDSFAKFLDASRKVVDVGLFATAFLVDVGDHPDLPFDEQLVHGLADAGLRFALREGAEKGAEFVAGALTAALLPALGAVFAPLVSQLAGAVAATLVGELSEAVDGATDVVDWVADRAVDVYRDIKAKLGFALDLAEDVVAVVAGAADLAGDAAEWLGDHSDDLVGRAVGVAGDLGDVMDDVGDAIGWVVGKLG